jgi:hypothetical protein
MSTVYDPDNWLISCTRALKDFVVTTLNDKDTDVEMSFPDPRSWTKKVPLANALIHFEQDHISDPVYGFGSPGDDVIDDTDPENVTSLHREAVQHLVNFDVGVWVSAQSGGVTKRMALTQALKDLFVPAMNKVAMHDSTQGIWVVSFEGGRNELDRINDVPVWRALDMTLVVRVVSRHTPSSPVVVPGSYTQDEELTILSEDGTTKPVTTP